MLFGVLESDTLTFSSVIRRAVEGKKKEKKKGKKEGKGENKRIFR